MNSDALDVNYQNGVLTAKITCDIDHHRAKHIRQRIDACIFDYRPSSVWLDLSAVDFMDSSGLGLILGRYNTACEVGSDFIIFSPSRSVQKILELAGIERIIKIEGEIKI